MKTLKILIALLIAASFATSMMAQNPRMVMDINPGTNSAFFIGNNHWVSRNVVNGDFYIQAYDNSNGVEVWKSTSPYNDASLVKDLNPGTGNGSSGNYLSAFGKLYFSGADASGSGLCRSDGTSSGTTVLMPGSSSWFTITVSQGQIFSVYKYIKSYRQRLMSSTLWKTDPVSEATIAVKTFEDLLWTADVNGTLVFEVYNSRTGFSLWKSNGTSKGTVKFKDLPLSWNSYPSEPKVYSTLNTFYVVDGTTLYFAQSDPVYGTELWKTNGTSAGTIRLTDINPGTGHSSPTMAARMGNYLYFSANDGTNGYQIWRYPLAGGNAERVTDINGGTLGANPMWITTFGDKLFFSAYTPDHGRELWISNGLTYNDPGSLTSMIDINIGAASSNPNYYNQPDPVTTPSFIDFDILHKYWMEPMGDYIYFPADDGTGFALWRSNGTITEKIGAQNPRYLTNVNGILLFIAYDDLHGRELWKYDPNQPPINYPMHVETIQADDYKIDLYPNPANESLIIRGEFKNSVNLNLRIYDILGNEMINTERSPVGSFTEQIDLSLFPAGMYIINFRFNGKSVQQKFIKK